MMTPARLAELRIQRDAAQRGVAMADASRDARLAGVRALGARLAAQSLTWGQIEALASYRGKLADVSGPWVLDLVLWRGAEREFGIIGYEEWCRFLAGVCEVRDAVCVR